MSPARRCASITSGRACTALRKRSSQSASCCEVRISTKKQLSSPSFSGSTSATSALIRPEAFILRIRFQTGVLEAPTLRAISSSGSPAVLLQQREDVPVQFVKRGSHSRPPAQCEGPVS